MEKEEIVNRTPYKLIKFLGKGKSGYSYLATKDNKSFVVLKKIHHEPCSYYKFGNKIEAELNAYKVLINTTLKIPLLIDVDKEKEIIVKEYIEGKTIFELIKEDQNIEAYINEMQKISAFLYENNINIDYFPTNFVVKNNHLYYVDYEYNNYTDEWNFQNWGIKYWSKTNEFLNYLKTQKELQ